MKSGSVETYVLCTGIHNTCTASTTAAAAAKETVRNAGRAPGSHRTNAMARRIAAKSSGNSNRRSFHSVA